MISDITDIAIKSAKIFAIIAVSSAFLLAINTLLGLLGAWVSTTFIGEFFALVSMYLPFDAGTVFGSVLLVCAGIFSFKVAMKIFNLTSWSISSV